MSSWSMSIGWLRFTVPTSTVEIVKRVLGEGDWIRDEKGYEGYREVWICRGNGSGCRDTLPVNAKPLEVLKARAKVRSVKTDYVFFNGAGNRMDARDLLRVFYPAMRRADVKRFRFHDLPHTFATRLVQAGCDIYTVQKLGGWKTISMVMRYAHHHPESLRAGIEILDRVPDELAQF